MMVLGSAAAAQSASVATYVDRALSAPFKAGLVSTAVWQPVTACFGDIIALIIWIFGQLIDR
jgi:hypothetical protein